MNNNNSEYIIEVENLVVEYGTRRVLDNISFKVKKGEIFVILGGSGCGKSTLLRTLVGLLRPSFGKIYMFGKDVTALNTQQQIELRKRIGMCFQNSALFNSMTVGENVALPLKEHTNLADSTIEIMTQIKLDLVGLGGCAHLYPSQLSGGMKKRAGIARAMALDPEIIFYDEPSSGLDPIVAAGLDQLIRKMQSTFNLTSVVVTHDLESVQIIADRVCLLHEGKIVAIGDLKEMGLHSDPYLRQFFARTPNPEENQTAPSILDTFENM
ncbi:MAG TPA: ABC transporter ATP-binding protein [Candidatus Hydrogenedens sp.]|nr:ABC transporter ATP-binding protein [Candidatus Hydrogenedens sp.]HPP58390.1 ABC transporter ATP-binding protein [Candidatus Hydrogenedens sp.]